MATEGRWQQRKAFLSNHFYHPQRSWGKVIFSQASVILLTGGGAIPACLAAGRQGVAWSQQDLFRGGGVVSAPGGWVPGLEGRACSWGGGCGLLLWSSVMPFWFGGLLIEGSLLVWSLGGAEGHNRRAPHQKAITEGHHTRRP